MAANDLGFVPDDGLGFTPEKPADADEAGIQAYEQLQAKHGGIGQQLLTGAESAGKGFVGPLAPLAEKGLTALGVPGLSPEEQEARARANPVTAGVGEAAGLGAGLLTGTGEAALMEKAGAALAPKLAAKIGLGKIGAGAIKAGIENAVYQSGDEVSKMINEDPQQTIGSAIMDVGLSSALGTVAGGAFGGASALWKKANGSAVGQGISDFVGRIVERINNPDPAAALNTELQAFHDNIASGADEVYGQNGIKAKAIKAGMPEMNEAISGQVNKINDQLGSTLEKLKNDPNVGLLQDAAEKFQEKVTAPGAGSADIFDATNELKQQLQEWGRYNKLAPPPLAERNFISTVKGIAFDLRNSLEDSDVWGKAGETQKAVNGAFAKFQPALKDFQSKFMEKVGGQFEIAPGKIQTFENQLGKAGAKTKQKMLQNFMDAAAEYKEAIEGAHADAGIENPFKETPTNAITRSLEDVTSGQKIADAVVDKMAGKLGGGAIGGAIGALGGHAWLGALVGEHALPGFLKSAMPALLKPFMEKEASAAGAKAAVDTANAAIRGQKLMTGAAKALFDEASPIIGRIGVDSMSTQKLDKMVAMHQQDPDKLAQVGGDLSHYMPDHDQALKSTAANAIGYLSTIKPVPTKNAPLDPEMEPPEQDKAQYQRALEIAEQPLTVLRLAKEGRLTDQDLSHLDSLYGPQMRQSMNQKITDAMTAHIAKGKVVPYATRLAISHLIGQPMDSSMAPQNILANQMALANSKQQKQNAQPGEKKKGSTKDMTLAARTGLHEQADV